MPRTRPVDAERVADPHEVIHHIRQYGLQPIRFVAEAQRTRATRGVAKTPFSRLRDGAVLLPHRFPQRLGMIG